MIRKGRSVGLAAFARLSLPLATLVVGAMLEACGPSDATETVAFVLSNNAERVKSIDFRVSASSGNFTKDDGGCDPSNAASQSTATTGVVAVKVGGPTLGAEGAAASTSSTSTTEEPATTTTVSSSTSSTSSSTTTLRVTEAEFSSESDGGQLTIHIANPNGIPPGSTLAFCRFQGNASSTTFDITTTACALSSGSACNPTSDAIVSVSTTTTTTTTTTTIQLGEDGDDCDAGSDCESGNCVNDVCCESACNGVCAACIEDLTGDPDGQCGTCNLANCVNSVCLE